MRNDSDTEAAAAPPNESREFIHECNNLLAGILNATALMRRARSEEDREEAIALIEDAVARAQKKIQHVPDLPARAVGSLARESMVSDDEAETDDRADDRMGR